MKYSVFYIWDESKYFKTLCELNKTWIASSDVLFLLKQSSSSTCTAGNTTGCKYGWLYDRTGTTCKAYGCLNNSDQPTCIFQILVSSSNDNLLPKSSIIPFIRSQYCAWSMLPKRRNTREADRCNERWLSKHDSINSKQQ